MKEIKIPPKIHRCCNYVLCGSLSSLSDGFGSFIYEKCSKDEKDKIMLCGIKADRRKNYLS